MYAGHLRSLYPKFSEIRSDPTTADVFDRAFILAIKEFERQGVQDPLNERLLVQHARVLMLGANYYGNPRLYESALSKLQRAVELAPRRVTTLLVLGGAYLNVGRTGKALEVFERAYTIYPPFGQTHGYLAATYSEMGNSELAGRWLRSALSYGYEPQFSLVRTVVRALADAGSPLDGAELAWDYLRRTGGPLFLWGATPRAVPYERYAGPVALADQLLAESGDSLRRGTLHAAYRRLCPEEIPLQLLAGTPSRTGHFPLRRECWGRGP
jgi:tetratricopeptide (TPR) repeat protein